MKQQLIFSEEVTNTMKIKSVKSFNSFKSVIQTIYNIVNAHGGELTVETEKGEGSEIIAYLTIV